ncbi:MAG: hypothetical protein ABDH20_03865 [Thermus sp.]
MRGAAQGQGDPHHRAAHGIGRATLELYREGARLIACDLEEGPLGEATSATGAMPVVMDVADPALGGGGLPRGPGRL